MIATTSVSIGSNSSIETQAVLVKQAYTELKRQLHKHGLSMIPTKTDPEGQLFLQDPEACKAKLIYRRECSTLERMKHPEYYRELNRQDYFEHKEARLATNRNWRQKHPDKYILWVIDYGRRHPEKLAEIRHRRRAKLAGVVSTFTNDDYEFLFTIQEGRCAYCNKPSGWGNTLTKLIPEHMTPIDKGGSNTIENIVLACHGKGSCNNRKQNKTVEEYLQYLETTEKVGSRNSVEVRLSEVLSKIEALLEL